MGKNPYMIERNNESKELPGIYPGMLLEVLITDNRLMFVGKIEWVDDKTIQIVDRDEMSVPYIAYNDRVKMRGFYKTQAVVLEGVIKGSTDRFWRIEQVRSLQPTERRDFFRQNTSLKAKVMCVNEIFGRQNSNTVSGAKPYDCEIIDISAGGAMVKTKAEFETGDWLFLMDVEIIPNEAPFTFTCLIKRIIEREGGRGYGCEFCKLENKEQERLIRGILSLQRKELQARRSKR